MEVQQDHTGDKADLEPSGSSTETDRFGFILGNGINAGEGPSPVLVRHREVKWLSIISQWDDVSQRRSSKVKGQCQKGIPASLRAKCWPLLCGAMQRMGYNVTLYQTLDEQEALQNWVDVIERDTDRQFPFHEMFLSKDSHGQRELFRVLKAYTQFRPDEGYCQAQGPVAAVLLMNMPTEEAFWCLVQISELYLPGYYSPLLEGVLFDAAMLPWVLKRACPAAHRHLQRQGVEPLMFATDWLMCLYTRHLPFNTLLRVWDLFFCSGVRVLFQVAVVLVRRVLGRGDQREECDGQMETLERLRGVKDYLQREDTDAFIQEVCSVSLSEKDLQRRTERELEKWKKERPNSTFDPRGRCHGYLMAWERVKELEEKREKKEKKEEKGNLSLSLPLHRSSSSLSPSLLRKKWKKRGSKVTDDSEGSTLDLRLSHGDKQEKKPRNDSISSISSMVGTHRAKPDIRTEEPGVITQIPDPSKEGRHFRSSSDGSIIVARSAEAQTRRHTEEPGKPPDRTSGMTAPKEGPSESDENTEEGCSEKVETQNSGEEREEQQKNQQKDIPAQESQTVNDGQAEQTEAEENKQPKEIQTEKAKVDNKIQILKDREKEIIVEEKEEMQIVKDEPIEEIQEVKDNVEEETQTVKVKEDGEMETIKDKHEEAMQAAKNKPEEGMQTVKEEQEEETIVIDKQELQSSELEETQSQIDQRDEAHDSPEAEEVSTGQEEWKGQAEEEQESGETQTSHSQRGEVGQTNTEEEVTHTQDTRKDLHTHKGEQEDGVEVCSTGRPEEEEVQSDEEDVEREGEEDEEETDASSLNQDAQPQASASSLGTSCQEGSTSDPVPPPPQSSPGTDCSSAPENSQPDVGPLVEGDDQHTRSPLTDQHGKVLTAAEPAVEEHDQPQAIEAMTEATEEQPEGKGQETQEHMVVMVETTGSLQEEAAVNTSEIAAQETGSSFSRPQSLTTDASETPESMTASGGGEPTETVQLMTLPQSTNTAQLTQTDTSTQPHGSQIHQDNLVGSVQHRLSQSENTPHTEETEDHTDAVTCREEMKARSEGEISETQEVSLSQNNPDQTDLKELENENESDTGITEKVFAEAKQEQAGTEETSGSLNCDRQSRAERDSVASLSGAEGADVTPVSEPPAGGTKAAEPQLPASGQVRLRKYSNSRSSYPRVLSEDIFKDPKDIPLQDSTPPQPQSPPQTDEPSATSTALPSHSPASQSKNSSHTQGTTQTPKHASSPSKSQTLTPADTGKLTDNPKRMGLFQRLRGGTPKVTIPKILIQDFSEDAEEEAKLSSKERRKQKRERERREKEEEKLRKKREKEMEKELDKERKKPQTRGKSFQLPSSTFRGKDSTLKRSDSQTLVTRRCNSESYF
ncbi:microtubule-associated protein futsch [Sardina pilchardus]|uniref:microtubule-associated protein futsch n=1 Tax=Sardina pilchardus TaxID=27697 RepID=UPI002E14A9EF